MNNIMFKKSKENISYNGLIIDAVPCELKVNLIDMPHYVPILVDYDISKKTTYIDQYPVELINVILMLDYINSKYVLCNKLKNILKSFFDSRLLKELNIIIFGDETNTVKNRKYYENIPQMTDDDQKNLLKMFQNINELLREINISDHVKIHFNYVRETFKLFTL